MILRVEMTVEQLVAKKDRLMVDMLVDYLVVALEKLMVASKVV